jgi:tetratricopeptide (TPR) repeat protein
VLTGEAAVAIGAEGHGMVTGDIVNTAARLQGVAEPGTVLVGEATQRAASGSIAFESMGEQSIRGKSVPVGAWRALRVVANRGGAGRTAGLEPPFVGRNAEFALLKEVFHAVSAERRLRLVSITGQAGIGKSRLAWEFEKYIDGLVEGVYWHQGRSPAYGEGITFWALGEMVRRRAGILESDDEATTRSRLTTALEEFAPDDEERSWLEPKLLALLGHDAPAAAPIERGELFTAWRTFFERIADRGTTVLVFEDLQWADAGLIDFIEHLLEWSRSRRILVVTLARPELLDRRPTWGAGQRNFTSMHLEPLSDDAIRELLASLVPDLPPAAVRAILRRAEGVPLYAVETIRMLVADGTLVAEESSYRVAKAIGGLSVPDTLHALVAARLDSLGPRDRGLLQSAAVIGQSFTLPALAAVSGEQAETLTARLEPLARAELITRESDPRSPERGQYQFVQSVIREVALATLANRDRKDRHLAAARYFESLGEEELAGARAEHYFEAWRRATDPTESDALAAQARVALRAAAQRAQSLGSPEQALRFLRRAVDVTPDPSEQAALLERAARAAIDIDALDDAADFFQQAGDRYTARDDRAGWIRAMTGIARVASNRLRPHEAAARLQSIADDLTDVDGPEAATLLAELSRAYMLANEFDRSLASADRSLKIAERLDLVDVIADTLVTKGTVLSREHFHEGAALLAGAIHLAESRELTWVLSRGYNNVRSYLEANDPVAAMELMQRGIDLGRRVGRMGDVIIFTAGLAWLRYGAGEPAGALELVKDLDDESATPMLGLALAFVTSAAGALLGREDTFNKGEAAVRRLLPSITNPDFRAGADANEAWIRLIRGSPDEAEPFARRLLQSGTEPFWGPDILGHVGVRARRLDIAREALALLEAAPRQGRLGTAHLVGLQAVTAALEGRLEAGTRLQLQAIRAFEELDQGLVAAEQQLEWALVRAGAPDGATAARAAREAFKPMGARPYVEQVDALLASAGEPRRQPSEAREAEAERA